jgi:hypothetical protein
MKQEIMRFLRLLRLGSKRKVKEPVLNSARDAPDKKEKQKRPTNQGSKDQAKMRIKLKKPSVL